MAGAVTDLQQQNKREVHNTSKVAVFDTGARAYAEAGAVSLAVSLPDGEVLKEFFAISIEQMMNMKQFS